MAHQMKNLCGFSVFHCVEGAVGASSGGTPIMKDGAPRDELPKGVLGKGVGNTKNASEMRQKCVKSAPKWVLFYWEKRNVPKCVRNASKIRPKCVKSARNTVGGKHLLDYTELRPVGRIFEISDLNPIRGKC